MQDGPKAASPRGAGADCDSVATPRVPLLLSGAVAVALTVSVAGAPTPAEAVAKRAASFSVSPAAAVAGQPITLSGRVPSGDRRPLEVEKSDIGIWYVVGQGESRSDGTYSLSTPQGAMDPESFRVVAPRHVAGKKVDAAYTSPTRTVHGIFQDVSLANDIGNVLDAVGGVLRKLLASLVSPRQFALAAQVTPADGNRVVTFQRRTDSGTWTTVGRARTGSNGVATLTASTSSNATYRAVAGAYQGMSWYPSLPDALALPPLDDSVRPADPASPDVLRVQPSSATSAATTYRWGPIAEDWNWESGQSLDPWSSYSDGSGDARIFVGMLLLDSGQASGAVPNFGDVTATLRAKGHKYGRWEWRSRAPEGTTKFDAYTMNLQLVPRGTPDRPTGAAGCAANTIDVASFTGYSPRTTLSVSHGGTTYTRTAGGTARNSQNWHTYAVEVTPSRITWLIDHKVVGTMSQPQGVPGVALVPRLELRAPAGVRMTHSRIGTDWIRYYPLRPARALPSGPRLAAEATPQACR